MTQNTAMLVYELSKAKSKIQNPTKNATADHGRYKTKYATLEQVMTAVTDTLLEHGIVWQQIAHDCEAGAKIETVLMGHGSEIYCGPVFVPAERVTPHAFGSAMTYARRYSLALACGVGSDEDNDALIVQEEYTSKPQSDHANKKPTEAYHIYITDTSSKVVQSVDEFLNGYRAATKDENGNFLNSDLLTDLANRNYAGLKRALEETRNDPSISGVKKTRRIKFLEEHLGYADTAQE